MIDRDMLYEPHDGDSIAKIIQDGGCVAIERIVMELIPQANSKVALESDMVVMVKYAFAAGVEVGRAAEANKPPRSGNAHEEK